MKTRNAAMMPRQARDPGGAGVEPPPGATPDPATYVPSDSRQPLLWPGRDLPFSNERSGDIGRREPFDRMFSDQPRKTEA